MNNIVSMKEFIKNKQNNLDIELSVFIRASAKSIYNILSTHKGLQDFMECELTTDGNKDLKIGAPIKFYWAEYANADDDLCSGTNGGEVVDMIPHKLISFTWGDAAEKRNLPWGSTLVEFKFDEVVENGVSGTRFTIHHYNLPNEAEAKDHQHGWNNYLTLCVGKWEGK